jgi:ClpP class serine protease
MQTNNVMSWILAHRWAIRPEMLRTMTDIAARGMADGRFRDAASAQVDFQDEGTGKDAIAAKDAQPLQGTRRAEIRDGIAIIKIVGPIFPRANMFTWISGGTSVELLAKDLQAVMTDESVKGLILNIDSPGGEVTGVSELADMIYNARAVKPIVSYGVGDMASAAYWIASATASLRDISTPASATKRKV